MPSDASDSPPDGAKSAASESLQHTTVRMGWLGDMKHQQSRMVVAMRSGSGPHSCKRRVVENVVCIRVYAHVCKHVYTHVCKHVYTATAIHESTGFEWRVLLSPACVASGSEKGEKRRAKAGGDRRQAQHWRATSPFRPLTTEPRDGCRYVCRHVYKHVYRHVYRNVCRHVCGHVFRDVYAGCLPQSPSSRLLPATPLSLSSADSCHT